MLFIPRTSRLVFEALCSTLWSLWSPVFLSGAWTMPITLSLAFITAKHIFITKYPRMHVVISKATLTISVLHALSTVVLLKAFCTRNWNQECTEFYFTVGSYPRIKAALPANRGSWLDKLITMEWLASSITQILCGPYAVYQERKTCLFKVGTTQSSLRYETLLSIEWNAGRKDRRSWLQKIIQS